MEDSVFKLTYSTMFDPPEMLHERFEEALITVGQEFGKEHGMMIAGQDLFSDKKFEEVSPADATRVLGVYQSGSAKDAESAIAAARKAFPDWSRRPWPDRVAHMRKVANLINRRIFEMGAAMALSVGKNRMESLGEVAETVDLIDYACDQIEQNNGFTSEMGRDPIKNRVSRNVSVLRPHGVWLIISPFNFPLALTAGPAGAAMAAGNTVVAKPSSDAPWTARLFAECCRDAGLPDGVFNFVTGPGESVGEALIGSNRVDGVTFTGSLEVGMNIFRRRAEADYVRPVILEMGGKNPTVVSRNADPETAALGIVRSAFGLQGQKCSACSRVYIESPIYDAIVDRITDLTKKLVVGDPTLREVYMGPVINQKSYQRFMSIMDELSSAGVVLTGGSLLTEADLAKGYFCAPTVIAEVPLDHRLWKHEMFLPIVMIAKVANLTEAFSRANDSVYGLTAGFYGSSEEANRFFEEIEVGVAYANRPVGATTGAWPGFQPFGGWKGSGASGKNSGGKHYVQLYLREQVHSQML